MMKAWKVKAYAVVVKAEVYDLEPVEGSSKEVVPEDYRLIVAEYMLTGKIDF